MQMSSEQQDFYVQKLKRGELLRVAIKLTRKHTERTTHEKLRAIVGYFNKAGENDMAKEWHGKSIRWKKLKKTSGKTLETTEVGVIARKRQQLKGKQGDFFWVLTAKITLSSSTL